jgi:hypothetical protein
LVGDGFYNVGGVSNPMTPDLGAWYVLLHATSTGYTIAHHWVEYDRAVVIAELERVHHPTRDYIIGLLRGEKVRHHWGQPLAKDARLVSCYHSKLWMTITPAFSAFCKKPGRA